MNRHLLLRLDAPLISFGREAVDAAGVVGDFPALSAITGLIGNALGWDRAEGDLLNRLQRRLVMGSLRAREGQRLREFQTAQLERSDRGWTTRGRPEGRAGGVATYTSPHLRQRDVDADAVVVVAMRLHPEEGAPDLDQVAEALDRPERPLFVGRKPFLPSGRLCQGFVQADTVRAALELAWRAEPAGLSGSQPGDARGQWPDGEGDGRITQEIADERNWQTGVHTGLRRVIEGWVTR